LFNILVTYQSLAERDEETAERARLAWPIRQPPERIYMPTNYTLSLEVTPQHHDREALELSCFYDHRIIDQAQVARLLATVARVLDYITTAPCTTIGQLKLEEGQPPLPPRTDEPGRASPNGSDPTAADVPSEKAREYVRRLSPIWSSVLRLDEGEFGPEDTFASLGGDSVSCACARLPSPQRFDRTGLRRYSNVTHSFLQIAMMRLSVRLTKAGLAIPVQALTKLPTMRAQAEHLACKIIESKT
jgi:hypothetical protein